MRRVEALAMWTESLRDTIAGAVGLEQAIPASARGADPVLRPHLDALVDRLRGRMPLAEALQLLADEMNDPSADIIIAALILNSQAARPRSARSAHRARQIGPRGGGHAPARAWRSAPGRGARCRSSSARC